MSRYALEFIPPPTQTIQPYWFGDNDSKETWLWLEELPELVPTGLVSATSFSKKDLSPSKDRGKERSRFFPGIAEAMAAQWGDL